MTNKLIPVTQVLEDSFVYSCTFDQQRGHEQFVPYHVLAFQFSGETSIQYQNGKVVLKKNQIVLAQKNQLTKSVKTPGSDKLYKNVSVILTDSALKKYAADNLIHESKKYVGEKLFLLKADAFVKSYFHSLLPYVEQMEKSNKKLAAIKTNEAIELLLNLKPSLKSLLFDFSEPRKVDLEAFMIENFHYNVSIDHFAKLTGRSLAAFKRDFDSIFRTSPRKWLQEKRLDEAYRLIKVKKKKPNDFYLELGFENLSHFYTSFKQKFGLTPATIEKLK